MRRRLVVVAVAAAAVASATLAFRFLPGGRPAGRFGAAPNVVLVTLDTLRSDRLSCYGSRTVDTPRHE